MSNWFHRFLNPHCPHCLDEMRDNKVCSSCETLRAQLERVTHENQRLLDKILIPVKEEVIHKPMEVTPLRNVPWNVRKQMLEAEDREKARLMREAPKPTSIEELEKEMDVAATQREEAR